VRSIHLHQGARETSIIPLPLASPPCQMIRRRRDKWARSNSASQLKLKELGCVGIEKVEQLF
jgi:hypothetical protein